MSILQRLKNNIAAIKYALTGEGDKNTLYQYTGFGGINAILYAMTPKTEWPKSALPFYDDILYLMKFLVMHSKDNNEFNQWVGSLKSSVLTAFYTPDIFVKAIIGAIYGDEIHNGNFTYHTHKKNWIQPRFVLDPAAGNGVFMGEMKGQQIALFIKGSVVTGVEKDMITALLLQQQYKGDFLNGCNHVYADSFEHFPKEELGTYDLVSTNVPFGDISVFDPDYSNSKDAVRRAAAKYIHRYYVLKGLDCLRDGGIEAYIITSNYLNKDSEQVAEALKHANLIGAYRLANNLFKDAGTEVGTDLLVLQKQEVKETMTADESFLLTTYTDDNGCPRNMYFTMHPDHIIATEGKVDTDAYGKPGMVYQHKGGVHGISDDMCKVLSKDLTANLNVTLFNTFKKKAESKQAEQPKTERRYKYMSNEKGDAMLAIRDVYNKLFITEATTLKEDVKDRKELNRLYDAWTKKHGAFNNPFNKYDIKQSAPELLALEVLDGKTWTKADIFLKPVAFATDEISHADTAQEALAISLNDYGFPKVDYMMSLTGMTESELLAKLDGDVYYNPLTEKYEIKAKFVSGNVVEKIKEIRKAYDIPESNGTDELAKSNIDPKVLRSLRALEDAVPTPIPFEELDFNLGERWIGCDLYSRFASEFFSAGSKSVYDETEVTVNYDPILDQFAASADNLNEKILTEYFVKSECSRYDGVKMLVFALQDTCPKMYRFKRDADGCKIMDANRDYVNEEDAQATQMANAKMGEIRQGWVDWLTQQPKEVKDKLAKEYNERFNCFVKPKYDGSHQKFPGLDWKGIRKKYGVKDLYQSQKDCIWMLIQNGGGICDHEVGSGKTFIMCIAAHEMKRLGLVHKPMIIGLKANVGAIAETYQACYPQAKILYAQNKDFHESERVAFFNRMKNNDYDCVIMSHDQFGRLPQSKDVEQQVIQDELDQLEEAMNVARGYDSQNSSKIRKGLERRKRNLETKLSKVQSDIAKNKDKVVDFKMMGIDHIFVDESHMFKNLGFTTRHDRVAGLGNTEGSKRAYNLLMAIRTIQERTGKDLGATFLSGTTVTNSLTELYSLFRYLRPRALAKQGITCFDAWAAIFTKKSTEFEFSITNQIIMKERFRYFIKVPELAQFYNEITDFRTAEDVGIERPKKHARLLNIEPTPDQQEFTSTLMEFAKTGDFSLIGKYDLTEAQQKAKMLYATDMARKMALDMRMIDPSYPDHPRSKSSMCAKLVKQYYDKYDSVKGTQLIFSDLSTWQGKNKGWNVYDDIKQKLVAMGIPSSEIRFIQECKSETTKAKLIQDVNDGKVRVLFGSTSMLGTGVNAQKRVVAVHHLDTPWRPSDLEQRDGRAIRKGNEIAKLYADNTVDVIIYAVRRTLDAYKFGLLNNKQTFINQLKRGQLSVRTLDEGSMDEKSGMNYAEYMAVLSGNTDLLERAKLEKRIAALEAERKAFYRDKAGQEQKQQRLRDDNVRHKENIAKVKQDLTAYNAKVQRNAEGEPLNFIKLDNFTPYVKDKNGKPTTTVLTPDNGEDYDSAIGEALLKIDKTVRTGGQTVKVGSIYGFDVTVRTNERITEYTRQVEYENLFAVNGQLVYPVNATAQYGHGKLNRVSKKLSGRMPLMAINRLPDIISGWQQLYDENAARIEQLDTIIKQPWGKDTELAKLRSDLSALDLKINQQLEKEKKGEQKVA